MKMAKPAVVEPKHLEHAAKVARVTGSQGVRNVALLYTLFGAGLTPGEIAALRVADCVSTNGEVKKKSLVRAEIAYNGYERTVYWTNAKLTQALDDYLDWRVEHQVSLGTTGRFRGLDPHSFLFINGRSGEGFKATRYMKDGVQRESAMVLSALFKQLLKQAGVEGCARSGRRTFAVLLARQGKDPAVVREALGLQSLTAAKQMMQGDPVRMGDIVARVF
ncbi:MAG: integrase/recombinase XerD [Azoarcus sp.]|nr:integrase/recombinase XerD [Azoarcus sp.]